MTESRHYLHFFKKYLLLLTITPLIFGAIGGYIQTRKAPAQLITQLFEIQSTAAAGLPSERLLIADQIVSITRNRALQEKLGVTNLVTIARVAPFAIEVTGKGQTEQVARESLGKTTAYISQNYPIQQIATPNTSLQKSSPFLGLFIGFSIGFSCSLLIALVAEYLANY